VKAIFAVVSGVLLMQINIFIKLMIGLFVAIAKKMRFYRLQIYSLETFKKRMK